ncbi:hypothetical protein [Salipaludibacillus agaradhaerens]|uniref:hypothetical protein n=1 Tax=Salipaludibacillus agaradhaerens TaxID=76935 RepID=UPI001FEAA993|nr:hypothetical protein [Salipaludibacillus agaradhaerens]
MKPFENTDDDYSKKAKDIKKKYTSMWEAIVESFKKTLVGSVDFIKGLVAGLVDLVEGVLVLARNGLILVISDIIPDDIEPAFLKDKADSIKDGLTEVTKQLLEDPFIIVESIGQSISDTWEEEGIMYASGYIAADVLVSIAGGKALQSGSILGDVSRTGRTLDKLGDTTQALDKAGDVAKQVDRVEDVVKGTVRVLDDGTVWENIKITQPLYDGTKIPKSFELVVDGEKFWVHPNGTKHMVEYITRDATTHGIPINSQTLLSSFQTSVKNAVKSGIKYEEIMKVGNWELIFSKPRGDGLLPVIKHAVYMP